MVIIQAVMPIGLCITQGQSGSNKGEMAADGALQISCDILTRVGGRWQQNSNFFGSVPLERAARRGLGLVWVGFVMLLAMPAAVFAARPVTFVQPEYCEDLLRRARN